MASALSVTVQPNYGILYRNSLEMKLMLVIFKVSSVPGTERAVPVLLFCNIAMLFVEYFLLF